MKGCAYYKLIVEKGDVTQAFKVPMRLIQKTWTLLIEGTLAFRLLGNREKSAFMLNSGGLGNKNGIFSPMLVHH